MNGEVDAARGLARISLYHEQSSITIDEAPLDSGFWHGYGCYQLQTDEVIDNWRSMQKEECKLIKVLWRFLDFGSCEFLKILGEDL
jgi:hypothetical protein